jgi:hypothetical protein
VRLPKRDENGKPLFESHQAIRCLAQIGFLSRTAFANNEVNLSSPALFRIALFEISIPRYMNGAAQINC